MWGTTRAHIANMIHGVTVGWRASLKMVGVGYRAMIARNNADQQTLQLKLGYANTIELIIPEQVKALCPTPDTIELEGICKQTVTQFAATIRSYKPPEPYNQKGIFVNGETIAKKKGKKR
jgi:large subunit ribosomal protein L6